MISATSSWQRAVIVLTWTVVGAVVLGALYWAQMLFIPVALAIFLVFLTNPLVRIVQHRGLGRIPSVIVVVLLAALFLGGLGWLVTWQVTGLLAKLPDYTTNIREKIESLQELIPGSERLQKMIEEISGDLQSRRPGAAEGNASDRLPSATVPAAGQPTAVVPQPQTLPSLGWLSGYLGAVAETVVDMALSLGLALVLVVFMLLKREDLRNRFIRLVGRLHMTETTKALDDAGERISRYLLMQLVVNGTYGLAWGLGLFLIGVDYALLWGFLAAILRYIPYLGPWIGGLVPITLSLAMFAGWVQPLLVIGLFLLLELVSNNLMEPWLYGHSMGVSEVAQLVSAAIWAFLWGPVGLVLSAPMTVVLLVLGKHIPQLEFLAVILGNEPALDPDVTYYQRLLARDQDEAAQLVLAQAKTSPDRIYDELLVPALNYVKRDRERDNLTEADEQFVLRATREIVEDLGERQAAAAEPVRESVEVPPSPRGRILGCPGNDEGDRLALEMLGQLLDSTAWDMEVLSLEALSADELVALAAGKAPVVICIGALPPGGLAHTRYLCKRLRARLPETKIVVGRWGLKGNVDQNEEQLRAAGADQVATTLLETRRHLCIWLPVLAQAVTKTTRDRVPRKDRQGAM